jgi:hypothetical protein
MDDQTPEIPVKAPRPRRGPPRRRLQDLAQAQSPKKKAAAAAAEAEVAEHEAALKTAGLLDAAIPEADVLRETPAETLAKMTREEKDKVSLAEAMARTAEIDANDDGTRHRGSQFHVNPSIIPAGWHYEWRRDTVLNQRDPHYLTALAKAGWRAVPRSRHPEMMPADWPGDTILLGGQILMEIPKVIAQRRKDEALQDARAELEAKLAQINGRSAKDQPGAQPRRGTATREFGPILDANRGEQAYRIGGDRH